MKKNLEIEHASELNSLQKDYAAQIESLKLLLTQEEHKSENALNERWEVNRRVEQLAEDLDTVKRSLETERLDHEKVLCSKQLEIDEREKAISEIKPLQEKAKSMIKRAQNDWCLKNEELQNLKSSHDNLEKVVKSLLGRFTADDSKDVNYNLESGVIVFQESLEGFISKYDEMKTVSLRLML